jgi:hypothetical protein
VIGQEQAEMRYRGATHSIMTTLFTQATVTSQNLGACSFEHLCVRNCLVHVGEDPKFSSDRDIEILVKGVD